MEKKEPDEKNINLSTEENGDDSTTSVCSLIKGHSNNWTTWQVIKKQKLQFPGYILRLFERSQDGSNHGRIQDFSVYPIFAENQDLFYMILSKVEEKEYGARQVAGSSSSVPEQQFKFLMSFEEYVEFRVRIEDAAAAGACVAVAGAGVACTGVAAGDAAAVDVADGDVAAVGVVAGDAAAVVAAVDVAVAAVAVEVAAVDVADGDVAAVDVAAVDVADGDVADGDVAAVDVADGDAAAVDVADGDVAAVAVEVAAVDASSAVAGASFEDDEDEEQQKFSLQVQGEYYFSEKQLKAPNNKLKNFSHFEQQRLGFDDLCQPEFAFKILWHDRFSPETDVMLIITVKTENKGTSKKIELKYPILFKNREVISAPPVDSKGSKRNQKARDKLRNVFPEVWKRLQEVPKILDILCENAVIDQKQKETLSQSQEKKGELLHLLIDHKENVIPLFISALKCTGNSENIALAILIE